MYRILAPTAILGYGFPIESFNKALQYELDLIAVDAGSMDAGPYYLGSGSHYVGDTALERDLSIMIQGAISQDCPLIIGSAGFAGSRPQFDQVVSKVKKILQQQHTCAKLATIPSDLDASQLARLLDALEPLGTMPKLEHNRLRRSKLVAQMGIEPIIAALEAGAQFIICGRCYDPAIFAADPIRKGYPSGTAFHAAKILECGAIACEPGSGSDCLIAELDLDGNTVFYPTNAQRKATVKSIAAHTLYEKSSPDVFHMPGGILTIRDTRFYQVNERKAGFAGSKIIRRPYSLKIEGSCAVGERVVSLIPLKRDHTVDGSISVYGRNAVEIFEESESMPETGILVVTSSENPQHAKDTLAFIRSSMLHYGYKGRISTAGNLAFPFSPSDIYIGKNNNRYQYFFVAGTRDPFFQESWEEIKQSVLLILRNEHPDLESSCGIDFIIANQENPMAMLVSVESDLKKAMRSHQQLKQSIADDIESNKLFIECIPTGVAYEWSVHHLVTDPSLINELFEIKLETLTEQGWQQLSVSKPEYEFISNLDSDEIGAVPNEMASNSIKPVLTSSCLRPLTQLASVIRSKNSGINQITFDIIFKSKRWFLEASESGLFSRTHLAQLFRVKQSFVINCYKFEPVWAIKFTLQRPGLSGGSGDRDVFGAQQHSRLLNLLVPTSIEEEPIIADQDPL